ncbi:MAG: hypothetical protein HY928_04305 [Elusimicrobia bacterium]|nr:hypothetical protein [Elusimicrobiota bacterium]
MRPRLVARLAVWGGQLAVAAYFALAVHLSVARSEWWWFPLSWMAAYCVFGLIVPACTGSREQRPRPSRALAGIIIMALPLAGPFVGYQIFGVIGAILAGLAGAAAAYILAAMLAPAKGEPKEAGG